MKKLLATLVAAAGVMLAVSSLAADRKVGTPVPAEAFITPTGGHCTDDTYCPFKFDPISGGLIINGSFSGGSASLTPFAPSGNTTLAATTTTNRVVLPSADTSVLVQNLGAATAYVKFGTVAVNATLTDTPVLPGQSLVFNSGASTYLAGITSSGTASLTITTGSGVPIIGLSLDNSSGVPTKGSIAEGSTAADPPVYAGCRATTATPTARTDGQVVSTQCDKFGRVVTAPFNSRDLNGQSALITLTSTTETTLVAAGGAGVFIDLTGVKLCNTSAVDVRADIRDATAGTVLDSWFIKAGYCTGQSYTSPFKQTTANSNWTVQLSGAVTDVRVKAGYTANK